VAAWTLQVLQEEHDTILYCVKMPDFARVDDRYGTKLSERPPKVVLPSKRWAWLRMIWPGKGVLMKQSLAVRDLLRIDRRFHPSIWVTTNNEMPMPKPGLQYIHWPDVTRTSRMGTSRMAAPPVDWSWLRLTVWLMLQNISLKMGMRLAAMADTHRSVSNSKWTVRTLLPTGGREVGLIYPPVPPFPPGLPWEQRAERVVCLGRWNPLKRMDVVVDIVRRARLAGASNLHLAFAGFWDATVSEREAVMKQCGGLDWIEWHEGLGREDLQELVGSSRYGLHAMIDEHFGIAIAEMMTAGCVVFAHDSGGPPEILVDRRQVYADAEDGGRILHEVCSSPALQAELHQAARPRGMRFSPEIFCDAIREEIKDCETIG
jgi:glycosyltransferase involved in cell wall biosynthesis